MKQVYKYPIPIQDYFTIDMHEGAEILYIETQFGNPRLWALVDTQKKTVPRKFLLVGTGSPVDERIKSHIGSFQMWNGELVYHIFEI